MRKHICLALFFFFVLLVLPAVSKAATPMKRSGTEGESDVLEKDIYREMQKEEDLKKKQRVLKKEDIPPIKMVLVKGGCFDMGDFNDEGDDDEKPVHKVCLTDYYIQNTEVTQKLYETVMGVNPSAVKDPGLPVQGVSYHMARLFIKRLNEVVKGFYRLPTEAEWEYAARSGGKKEKWSGTNNEAELGNYSWFIDNAGEKLHKPMEKKPNGLGIYDMSGNLWEWTEDNFDFDYYQTSPQNDPLGADISYWRVVRGGSFVESPYKIRTTYRYAIEPDHGLQSVGFRLAE